MVMNGGSTLRVAIVGGGIGGLAAAAFLGRAGVADVTVFEQAPELGEVGAGIQVAPNVARLLHRIGLASALDAIGTRLEVGWEMRRWENGRVLSSMPLGAACEARFGAPYHVVHRAGLIDALSSVLADGTVQTGHRCVAVRAAGEEVELTFDGGEQVRADVVIGADGIHSTVRGVVAPPMPPRFSGLAAYRSIVPAAAAPALAKRPVFTSWLGPGRHLVHYPLSAGGDVNVIAVVPAQGWRTESWAAEGSVAEFAAEFTGWDERVRELVAGAPAAWLYALYDREPLERWTAGRVALLGDAAHPMLPFFAQGAGQAIEDAAVLALCLGEATPHGAEAALLRYERARWERASRVQRASRGRPELNHLADGEDQRRRDTELASSDPIERDAWLYGHDAELELTQQGAVHS
jgi:salicylate hydroxylase